MTILRATVDVRDNFQAVTDAIRRKSAQAVEDAAQAGHIAAQERAQTDDGKTITTFFVVHPTGTIDGFVTGIKAKNRLLNIFEKGSLGKRTAALKNPGRRKDFWNVNRGTNPYVAHRGDTTGEGIAPRHILTYARAAGRRALLAALRR